MLKSETQNLSHLTKMPSYESLNFSTWLAFFGRKAAYVMAKPWFLLVGAFPIQLGSRNAQIWNLKTIAIYENGTVRKYKISYAIVRKYEISNVVIFFGRKVAYVFAKRWDLLVRMFPIKLGSRNAKIKNSKIAATYESATVRNLEFSLAASVFWQKSGVRHGEAEIYENGTKLLRHRTKVKNFVHDYLFWPKSSVRHDEAMSLVVSNQIGLSKC